MSRLVEPVSPNAVIGRASAHRKQYRIVNNVDVIASLQASGRTGGRNPFYAPVDYTFLTGENGLSGGIFCDYATAWTTVFVEGELDSAKIDILLGARQYGSFFKYPSRSGSGTNIYDNVTGITAPGIYCFERLLGNLFCQIEWSNAGSDADFHVSVSNQMV